MPVIKYRHKYLPPLTRKQAETFFESWDTSKDGRLTILELQKALCRAGIPSKDVREMFTEFNTDGDCYISKKEFLDQVCEPEKKSGKPKKITLSREQATKFFNDCDVNKDGNLTVEELFNAICKCGFDREAVDDMFADLDKNKDGSITLKEFVEDVCAPNRSEAIDDFFKKADKNETGTITLDELLEAAKSGSLTDVETLQKVFKNADKDNSGSIDIIEFRAAMAKRY